MNAKTTAIRQLSDPSLIRSASQHGHAFADGVVASRHLLDQIEAVPGTYPDWWPLPAAFKVAKSRTLASDREYTRAIGEMRRRRLHLEAQAIIEDVTERTRGVRERNLSTLYPEAIPC